MKKFNIFLVVCMLFQISCNEPINPIVTNVIKKDSLINKSDTIIKISIDTIKYRFLILQFNISFIPNQNVISSIPSMTFTLKNNITADSANSYCKTRYDGKSYYNGIWLHILKNDTTKFNIIVSSIPIKIPIFKEDTIESRFIYEYKNDINTNINNMQWLNGHSWGSTSIYTDKSTFNYIKTLSLDTIIKVDTMQFIFKSNYVIPTYY